MVALNTTDLSNITSMLEQIKSSGDGQINFGKIGSTINIGNILAGIDISGGSSESSEGSVSAEDYAKIAQDAVKKIFSMLGSNKEASTAKKEVDEQTKKSTSVTEQSKNLGIKLEGSFSEIATSIDAQNSIVNNATGNIEKVQEEVQKKQEKINELVEKIQAAKEKLAETTDPQEQANLLNEINGYALGIGDITESIQTEQATMDNLTATVEETVEKMESGTEKMTVVQEDGQNKIKQLTKESGECSKDAAQTGEKAIENKATAGVARAKAEMATSNIATGSTIAIKLNQTAADQDQASSTRFNGLQANIKRIADGIGNLTNNLDVLTSFTNSIGSSIHEYVNAIGSWDSVANPVIESIGSFETVVTGTDELKETVETDLTTIGYTDTKEKTDNGGAEQQAKMNTGKVTTGTQTVSSQAPAQGNTATQGTASAQPSDEAATKNQQNELLTPQFDMKKLSFGL